MSELERLEELRKLIQADYSLAKIEHSDACTHSQDGARCYFEGVMDTLEHVFNYIKFIECENKKVKKYKYLLTIF